MPHELYPLYQKAYWDIYDLGIKIGTIKGLSVNKRFKSTLGLAKRYPGENVYQIEIAEFLLQDQVPEQEILNVIAHELLHTAPGCHDHGEEWKRLAGIMNDSGLGYNIKRTTNIEKTGAIIKNAEPVYKYIFKCEDCGQILKRSKRSKFVKYYYNYRCGKCGGKLHKLR